ncbi:MAG: ATP-grasp domain-containing protein [Proteobacteria bacterium]|jgi:biotin carboxylase|nr:ATP-grasp domain-containing protein [Pseudomonadota bacterium]
MPGLPQILVIAPHGSYRTSAFITAAHRLGVRVLIASEGQHSIVSDYARGLHIDFADQATALELILQTAAQTPFAGIIGTDDSTVELAARSAAALGLPHNPPAAVRLGRRKDQARVCLQAAGLNVPPHRCLDLDAPLSDQLAGLAYPVVVKPVCLSASRGVIRADHQTDLRQAIARIQVMLHKERLADPDLARWLLVEQYIPGQEVALEGMLHDGRLTVMAVFDKPDPLEGPYFEETYYTTPSRHPAETQVELEAQVQAACAAYGLREGPIHAECRLNEHGVWILEVAARSIGGLCGQLLRFGTGYSLEELVLAQAMGRRLPVTPAAGGAGVLMIPIPRAGVLRRVEGLLEAQQVPGITAIDIQIREGHELVPLPEGASYLGFIFARGDTPAQAEAALRQAHACLNIVVAPLWKANVA